jgi:hypothetical protein
MFVQILFKIVCVVSTTVHFSPHFLYMFCPFSPYLSLSIHKLSDLSISVPTSQYCSVVIHLCMHFLPGSAYPLCLTNLLTHFAYLVNHHTKPYSKLGCSENLVILVCSIFLTGEDPPKPETSDRFTFCWWHHLSSSLVKGQGSTSINPVDNIHQAALA